MQHILPSFRFFSVAYPQAVAVASAGKSFGWNDDDILDELRNRDKPKLDLPKESRPSDPVVGNTDDPIANSLAGASVQIKLDNEFSSYMKYYSMSDESEETLLITERSDIIPTIEKYCHLFDSFSSFCSNPMTVRAHSLLTPSTPTAHRM